jgi:Cu-processing system ATP-binding protein
MKNNSGILTRYVETKILANGEKDNNWIPASAGMTKPKNTEIASLRLRSGQAPFLSSQLITIKNLKKSFGKNFALKGIDLHLEKGAVVAIMGPNGSGKTTLLKSILGLVKPDSGDIYVKDIHLNGNSEYRRYIGYMPQNSCFPENLRVKEVFSMLKDVWGNHSAYDEELMKKLNIADFENKQIGTLSGGTKQRVSTAAAFLFDQEIIILDEPTAGLDPVAAEIVKQKIIDEKNKGKLVIITSHVISEVEELADRVVFLLEGNIHVDSTVDELISKTNEISLNRAIAKIMIDFVSPHRGETGGGL